MTGLSLAGVAASAMKGHSGTSPGCSNYRLGKSGPGWVAGERVGSPSTCHNGRRSWAAIDGLNQGFANSRPRHRDMMTPITDIDLYPLPGNGRGNNNPDHMGNCTFHLAIDFIIFDAAPLRLFWWLTVRPFCGWRRVPELPTALGQRGSGDSAGIDTTCRQRRLQAEPWGTGELLSTRWDRRLET